MEKLILKGETSFRKVRIQADERLDPILGYCSDIISHLNREDSSRLTDNLLEILDDLRPCLKVDKKALPLIVELLDWTEIKNKERQDQKESFRGSFSKAGSFRK